MASEGTPARKRKLDEFLRSFANQETVSIIVEYGDQPPCRFNVHKSLLCLHSESSQAFFENNDEAKVMVVSDSPPGAIDVFVKWLYTKQLIVESVAVSDIAVEGGGKSKNDQPWHEGCDPDAQLQARLLDLYLLAETYKLATFKTIVMLEFQRSTQAFIPTPLLVNRALEKLDFDSSGMCKYLVQCYGSVKIGSDSKNSASREKFEKRLASLPAIFLARSLIIQGQRQFKGGVLSRSDKWCDYHEHKSDEEGKECEEGRPNDADMKRRQRGRESYGLVMPTFDWDDSTPSSPKDQF